MQNPYAQQIITASLALIVSIAGTYFTARLQNGGQNETDKEQNQMIKDLQDSIRSIRQASIHDYRKDTTRQ